jgi:outer membrane biosynthesis protein TonB
MGFDVNKIIMESIQEVIGEPTDKKLPVVEAKPEDKKEVVAETKVEAKVEDTKETPDTKEIVAETKVEAKVEDKKETTDKKEKEEKSVTENIGDENEHPSHFSGASSAALAAGLGALLLRKKLASLNETK